MSIFSRLFPDKKEPTSSVADVKPTQSFSEAEAHSGYYGSRNSWYPIITEHFDGEKTPGEMGAPRNLIPIHRNLSARVYEANLKSDLVKIITGKFFKWVIGTGLKLQAEPKQVVLESEGVKLEDVPAFRKVTEARFSVYTESRIGDHKNMNSIHSLAAEAYQAAFLGGDCLVVQRVSKEGNLTVQIIEGRSIMNPWFDNKHITDAKARGNTVKGGVEVDKSGQHVAFYIRVESKDEVFGNFQRIEARGKRTGRLLAWMMYGSKHRIDDVRGIPVITQILEKVEKFDRYTEATVGSAEERAKIVFAIEHSRDSDGSNPLMDKARQAAGMGSNAACETEGYALGEKTAAVVAATTGKQTFNMPIGAKLSTLASQNEIQYGPFSKAIFSYLCASVDIPPEVAMQLYEQNYSSSRAAINSWDYVVKVHRKKFSDSFYKPFYAMWFELEVIKGKISAPGFVQALASKNVMLIEGYLTARFTGVNMPHIDPLKEVKAVRSMLGDNDVPLISRSQAVEYLGAGDWEKNIEKSQDEEDLLPEEEIIEPDPLVDPAQTLKK